MFEPIDRRTALRNLGLVIGGSLLFPACDKPAGKASIALRMINVDASQEQFLADVAETIIPKTDTPGARDLGLHLFVLKMVDDCFSKKDQDAFIHGLDKVTKDAETRFGKPFGKCTQAQRQSLLQELDHKHVEQAKAQKAKQEKGDKTETPADDALTFYNIAKGETIFGCTYSKYFMTKQIVYELVPGRYNAHYPVSKFKEALKYG